MYILRDRKKTVSQGGKCPVLMPLDSTLVRKIRQLLTPDSRRLSLVDTFN